MPGQSSHPPHRHTTMVESSASTLPQRLGNGVRTWRVRNSLSRKKSILVSWSHLTGFHHGWSHDLIHLWASSPFLGSLGKMCFIVFSFWNFERWAIIKSPPFLLILMSSVLTCTTELFMFYVLYKEPSPREWLPYPGKISLVSFSHTWLRGFRLDFF